MPRTERGWIISTLQDHLEADHTHTLYCVCGHRLTLSTPRLIEIFGPDFEISKNRDYFLSRFRCNDCGKRPAQVTLSPGNVPRWDGFE
ncbi:hypothetical protein [Pelagibacterium lentulum]|uniref:Uncharacterized protein n=1 Tax=Pelagibacterium lentulum TaxID=2029865 RepID=A0A916RLG4_9HYPH|nr:hypothetical protein [Pelagibacterium lentulum]GGA60677.1 hypothetical protein GCM10011499_33680 [Pelagibacterium lentulum]